MNHGRNVPSAILSDRRRTDEYSSLQNTTTLLTWSGLGLPDAAWGGDETWDETAGWHKADCSKAWTAICPPTPHPPHSCHTWYVYCTPSNRWSCQDGDSITRDELHTRHYKQPVGWGEKNQHKQFGSGGANTRGHWYPVSSPSWPPHLTGIDCSAGWNGLGWAGAGWGEVGWSGMGWVDWSGVGWTIDELATGD